MHATPARLSLYHLFTTALTLAHMYNYDPTNAAAVSAGSQVDLDLWPTHATWSVDPNDSGVYCATTPGYGIVHTLNHHAAVVAMAASFMLQIG